jgi:O-antigen ligase
MNPSRGAVAVPAKAPLLLQFSFLLFVFTIPVESLNTALQLGPVSISRLSGLFFFGISIFYFRRCYSDFSLPLWCFVAYTLVVAVLGSFVEPTYQPGAFVQLFTLIQLVVFFWAGTNLLKDTNLSRKTLLAFAFGAVFFGVAAQLGLTGFAIDGNTRTSALGLNPDILGILFAVAGVILVGLALERLSRIFLLGALAITLSMMVVSGARGSVIAFVFGVACYMLPVEINARKLVAIVFGAVALVAMGYFVMSDPAFMARWTRTINDGDVAGRDTIMAHSLDMILESPLIGWGPNAFQYELEWRYAGIRDLSAPQSSHNLELEAFLEGGALGAFPFLLGIALCCRSAWKSRREGIGMVRIAALAAILVNAQFIPYSAAKPLWLMLAICAAANRFAGNRYNQEVERTSGSLHSRVFRPVASVPRQSW